MKRYRLFFFFLLFSASLVPPVSAQELSIGDTLPDYTFTSILRYSSPSVRLADFRGKLLVLDLWRTTCGAAVGSFTHFDSLCNEFPNQLSAIAITTEGREKIRHYLANNGYAAKTVMPVITDDTVLAGKRFPFIYIPHVVLADTNGTIVAITEQENITAPVIRDLLRGKGVSLPLKKEITDFDYDVPILLEGKGRNARSVAYCSTIAHQLPGVLSTAGLDTTRNRTFYAAYNLTIPQLYAQAYHIVDLKPNRLILHVPDPSRFYQPHYDHNLAWQQQNLWCYNLLLPPSIAHPERYAVADFDRFFGVTGVIEKRRVKCLLLVSKGKGQRWRSAGGTEGYYLDSGSVTLVHNVTMATVGEAWDIASPLPIIDKTGLDTQLVDMKIEGTPADLSRFRQNLQKYDLDLVPVVEELDMLVIREAADPSTKHNSPGLKK